MSNRDLLKQFADGTPLDNAQLDALRSDGWIARDGTRWRVTTAGAILLGPPPLPPGDSASCPDTDSYFPPPVRLDQLVRAERTVKVRAERDPLGKHQHETGAKLDAGKVRLGLVLGAFSNALVEVGKVGTYGAQKYTDNGWLDVPKGKARYTDALLRHIFAEANESHDPDTNLHHAAHAAWNALARLELILRKRGDE